VLFEERGDLRAGEVVDDDVRPGGGGELVEALLDIVADGADLPSGMNFRWLA
jgi:hypothetical protein